MLHSNPMDYAWGANGLDAIITQVYPNPLHFTRDSITNSGDTFAQSNDTTFPFSSVVIKSV